MHNRLYPQVAEFSGLTGTRFVEASIAGQHGVHRATVGRELARNRDSSARNDLGCMKGYFPHDAQQKANARRAVASPAGPDAAW